jgi:hypothetical protein
MDAWLAAISLILVLVLIAGRRPLGMWLYAALFALLLVVVVMGLERAGMWPDSWRR